MSKNILMAMIAMLIAAAPASAAELNQGPAGMGVANNSANEAVDCFYEQHRFLPECKKK